MDICKSYIINKGQISDINGQYYPTGSYLEKVDSRTGKRYIAFLNSGTMDRDT